MGSRIMHLIIGNRIADRLNMKDRTSFLIGSVAPDAVQTKDESHFFRGKHEDYTRYINYHEFIDKYKSHSDTLYVLGYFTHLIADDMWLKGFYMPWLRNRMEADAEVYPLYHNDFRLLNGQLLDHYGYTEDLRNAISQSPAISDLSEVNSSDIERFIPQVLGDMDYEEQVLNETLNVFRFIQIQGYIETSVNVGLMHLQEKIPDKIGDLW